VTVRQKKEELADLAREISPERLEQILTKSQGINIRVSSVEKAAIKAAAQRHRLTVTEYLTTLHEIAASIEGKKRSR
jgi:predicted DNA binding CopG/RHH family protein